jgi:hypothetical protein
VGAPGAPSLGELTHRVDAPEILAAVGLDDDGRVQPRGLVTVPDEELAPVAFEGNFYEVGHSVRE